MKWEFDILYALQKIHQPVLDHIMTGLSTIGNAGIFWIVLGLALCIPKKYRKIGIQMVISMAITFIIGNLILKNLIARERPCWLDTQIAPELLAIKNSMVGRYYPTAKGAIDAFGHMIPYENWLLPSEW